MSGVRDAGGTEFQRVLEALRTRIADGTYAVGSHLPAQRELAEELGVSRDTVQRVLQELNNEGWIKSRQGSGSRVVKSPTHLGNPKQEVPRVRATLGTFVARAFAQPTVRLDVFPSPRSPWTPTSDSRPSASGSRRSPPSTSSCAYCCPRSRWTFPIRA
ncbi:winged helix-turn-helix domain-containing protein [Streptomyces mirabilis]|uniref:winged helix-turn-helix domain-containing protein n=1 Tax=Streptomyces mirabilis TaxID=68239 RepID=UPI0033200BD2